MPAIGSIATIILFGLVAMLGSGEVRACSFGQPETFVHAIREPAPGEIAPAAPVVAIERITRGAAGDPNDSCADTGVITLAIPDPPQGQRLAYEFRVVKGEAEDTIFPVGVYTAGYGENGKQLFVFPWLDGASAHQEPLNLEVRVTAYSADGARGGHTMVHVVDLGR